MANVGYIRVSTIEQNTTRQLDGLSKNNVSLDKVFEDKVSSSQVNRPALQACLTYLREGDILYIHSIDRLARNLSELQSIVNELTAKGVTVHFWTENLIFSGQTSPMQELIFQMLGAFAQFERSLIKERQKEGIAKAKQEGRFTGRPRKISEQDKSDIAKALADGASPASLAEKYKVSKSSIYGVK